MTEAKPLATLRKKLEPRRSPMTTVPRTEATAVGVRISIVSPGRISFRATARAILPDCRSTVARPGSSVMVRTDSSRTVTRAFPPRSTRTIELSFVAIRSL